MKCADATPGIPLDDRTGCQTIFYLAADGINGTLLVEEIRYACPALKSLVALDTYGNFNTDLTAVSVQKVVRACALLQNFVQHGLDMTAARSPAGTCFKHPFYPGAQACACTDREVCNDSPFIGENDNGQFLASKDRPDDTGNFLLIQSHLVVVLQAPLQVRVWVLIPPNPLQLDL